jgi:DnaK suppressor protein
MDASEFRQFRDMLLQQRRTLLHEVRHVEADLDQLSADREPELEEAAQGDRTARVLARLDDRGKAELQDIDAALARLEEGRYGTCVGCGKRIPRRRLIALPATRHCRDCVERSERGARAPEEAPETAARPAPVPPDYNVLNEPELAEAIREHLHSDGRIDMEELRIVCRHDAVHLTGSVPSETEHQILLHILTDIMGLTEVVDRLQITEILWERDDRSKEDPAAEPPAWEEAGGTHDITESEEDGVDFVPPDRPVPDEE